MQLLQFLNTHLPSTKGCLPSPSQSNVPGLTFRLNSLTPEQNPQQGIELHRGLVDTLLIQAWQ